MQIAYKTVMFDWPMWIVRKPKTNATVWYYRGPDENWFDKEAWVDSNGDRPSQNNPIAPGDSYVFDTTCPNASVLFNSPVQNFNVKSITFGSTLPNEIIIYGNKTISGIESILNNTTNIHHTFNCPVECKTGIVPTIASLAETYVKFPGGLKAYALAQMDNLSSSSRYYCGNIELLTPNALWNGNVYASAGKTVSSLTTRVFIVSGSVFRVSKADLKWVTIEAGATVIVDELVSNAIRFFGDNNGSRFMQNYKSWYAYWNRPIDTCNGVIYVRNKISFNRSDLFMPNGDDENRKMLFNGIENSSTAVMSGAYKETPRVYLNTGYKIASSAAVGTFHHEQPVNIALGSGGLKVVSGANGNACFQVWKSSRLQSFRNWEIAAHPTSGNAVVTIDSGVTLAIDTTHVVTGIPDIDVVDKHTVTVNGKINGGGSLQKSGQGTLVFNTPLAVTGGLKIYGGTVKFNSTGNIVVQSPVKIGSTGNRLECGDAIFKDMDIASGAQLVSTGEITFASGATVTFRGFDRTPIECNTLVFTDATTTTFAFESDEVFENGRYVIASLSNDAPPMDYASLILSGSAISGKIVRLEWDASELMLVVEDQV